MKSLLVRSTCFSLLAGFCASAHAQSDNIPIDYVRPRDWTFSAGVRMTNEGAKVKFGRLGTVPSIRGIAPLDAGAVTRIYDNGAVGADGLRAIEATLDQPPSDPTKAVTNPITDPDNPGRYITQVPQTTTGENNTTIIVVDENGNAVPVRTGNFLKYQEGVTRNWLYSNESQLRDDGTIAMSSYSAVTDGATAEGEDEGGPGVEIALGRRLGRLGNRLEWGVTAAIGISDINVKSSGTVSSTLHTLTDFYSLNGQAAPRDSEGNLIFSQPSFGTYTNPGGTDFANSLETTVPLGDRPIRREEESLAGGAEVEGNWQIKGSYYLIRLGPNVRATLTERFALNASAGFAGAYLGTKYRIDERLILGNVSSQIRTQAEDEDSQFIAGFYGDLTGEFWLTERTGFYAGVTYENLGDYEQVLNGRTADVELGSGLGWRFGITTRF